MEAGDQLGGRYVLHSLVATGGMGQVWRARDTRLQRQVAVKVLRAGLGSDPGFVARFRGEARHAAMIDHPGVAAVHDYGEDPAGEGGESLAYLVMELVDGESLAQLLVRVGRLPAAQTLDVVRQTAAALSAAHAVGVVHRDVKPANVLIRSDGVVKITDFGIARSVAGAALTAGDEVVGTPNYIAPEQMLGQPATPASDVYALGAVAYECLSGWRAYDGDSSVAIALRRLVHDPAPLPPDVPPAVRDLVERAMARDPEDRFPDAAALRDAAALTAALLPPADEGAPAYAEPVPPLLAAARELPDTVDGLLLGGGLLGGGVLDGVLGGGARDDELVDGVVASGRRVRGRRRAAVLLAVAAALVAVLGVAGLVVGSHAGGPLPAAATPSRGSSPATTTQPSDGDLAGEAVQAETPPATSTAPVGAATTAVPAPAAVERVVATTASTAASVAAAPAPAAPAAAAPRAPATAPAPATAKGKAPAPAPAKARAPGKAKAPAGGPAPGKGKGKGGK